MGKVINMMNHIVQESVTFEEACDAYMDRPEKIGITDMGYIRHLREELGECKLDRMSRRMIDIVVTKERRARGLSESSIRRELNTLGAILNYAVDMELTENAVRVAKPSDGEGRETWMSLKQSTDFIDACDPCFKSLATFLFCTGARLGEARRARWEDVRTDAVLLSTRKGKGGKLRKRYIPILPTLRRAIGPNQDEGYVLKNPWGFQWGPKQPYKYWNEARDALGLSREYTPHSARHTFASLLFESGVVDSRTVAELLGHSSMDMMKRYTHLNIEHLRGSIINLGL